MYHRLAFPADCPHQQIVTLASTVGFSEFPANGQILLRQLSYLRTVHFVALYVSIEDQDISAWLFISL